MLNRYFCFFVYSLVYLFIYYSFQIFVCAVMCAFVYLLQFKYLVTIEMFFSFLFPRLAQPLGARLAFDISEWLCSPLFAITLLLILYQEYNKGFCYCLLLLFFDKRTFTLKKKGKKVNACKIISHKWWMLEFLLWLGLVTFSCIFCWLAISPKIKVHAQKKL